MEKRGCRRTEHRLSSLRTPLRHGIPIPRMYVRSTLPHRGVSIPPLSTSENRWDEEFTVRKRSFVRVWGA